MYHPGVRGMIDRILKQQPSNKNNELNLQVVDASKLDSNDKKLLSTKLNQNGSNKYTAFKSILQDKMKERRRRLREEELEEDKLNEEYHNLEENNDENNIKDKEKDDYEDDEDDENEEADDENEEEEENGSDDDFKLNLDDDDENNGEISAEKKLKKKNDRLKANNKNEEDEEELFDCDDILNYDDESKHDNKLNSKFKRSKASDSNLNDIPPASIPSNQLTSNSSIVIKRRKMNEYDFEADNDYDDSDTTQRTFRLYIETTDQQQKGKNGQRDDDIETISLNFDNVNNSANNGDLSLNIGNNTTPTSNHNNSSSIKLLANNDLFETEGDNNQLGEEFDELAMLCSGKFKDEMTNKKLTYSENKSQKMKLNDENEKNEDDKSNTSRDIDDDLKKMNKIANKLDIFCDDDTSKDATNEVDNNNRWKPSAELYDEDSSSKEKLKKSKGIKRPKNDDDDDDEEVIEDKEDLIYGDGGDVVIEDDDYSRKMMRDPENEDEYGRIADVRRAFFENEAELSGSEAESDENYDGDSNDESLVCSGDEDDLPSESELKEQLGQIYLKDQMDKDKRELRMFKEMYLADGELHQEKGHRKKNFRWKYLNDNRFNHMNKYSSDEEDEDDDDDDDNNENDNETKEKKPKDFKIENSKLFKTGANPNWRSNRYEREQFINKKNKNGDITSSDDETKDTYDDSSQTSSSNQILKLGQNLLKTKLKRSFHEIATTATTSSSTTIRVEETVNTSQTTTTTTADSSSQKSKTYLEKFSFLKKDKTYLSRISNYVNKTLNVNNGLGSGKDDLKKSSKMVFARLSQDDNNDTNKLNEESKNSIEDKMDVKTIHVQEPLAKKAKFSNNSESIFNHI